MIATTLFWSSLGCVAYTYLGYPIIIFSLSKLRPKPVLKKEIYPKLSIVMAVKNEQKVIADKLDNLLAMDYPNENLEIIVVTDSPTDETDQIIQSYGEKGVAHLRLESSSGKPAALNLGVENADGEIIVFCDARQRVESSAIKALVANFADPTVGAVSGELEILGTEGPGIYWKYEKLIRIAESRSGSVPGATGALYAIRKALFRPLPENCLLDDVFTPMQIALNGYRVIFDKDAKAYDEETEIEREFRRKVRTLVGNYQLIEQLPDLVKPWKNPIFCQLCSHKLIRLAAPWALASLLASNVVLVAKPSLAWPLYVLTLAGQGALYGTALASLLGKGKSNRISRVAETFVVLNAAAASSLLRYLKRDFSWNP